MGLAAEFRNQLNLMVVLANKPKNNPEVVPKKQECKIVRDFRPISLMNGIFKILSKMLSIHLSKLTGDIISDDQAAYKKVLGGCLAKTPPYKTVSILCYATGRKNKKRENTQIRGSAKKELTSTEHVNFTVRKRNITTGDLILNPHTPNFFLAGSSPSQKLSL